VFGPKGELVAEAGAAECVLVAEMDLEAVESWRREFPALSDMRQDL
jgi:predicted amidohydrolase